MPVQNFEILDTNSDVTTTRTLLHEVIPLTGTIVSGTYGHFRSERNVVNYSHGMFQSVYDYPYLSSSANHIFDITVGYDEKSWMSGSTSVQNAKKINIYNQYAQVLLGYTGSTTDGVRKFESDLQLDGNGTMKECVFINFSRLLTKDQIKKGTFSITFGTGSFKTPFKGSASSGRGKLKLFDISASSTSNTLNTIGGDYGVLVHSASNGVHNQNYGVVFYQAGIAVITASVFATATPAHRGDFFREPNGINRSVESTFTGSAISGACDAIRNRLQNLSFNNSTEINSKIYFCRVPHNKFNYSSNPTYTSGSKIVVKEIATDRPVSYITTIGLYSAANELLATAKLSEPIKKTPSDELILRVRLDY